MSTERSLRELHRGEDELTFVFGVPVLIVVAELSVR